MNLRPSVAAAGTGVLFFVLIVSTILFFLFFETKKELGVVPFEILYSDPIYTDGRYNVDYEGELSAFIQSLWAYRPTSCEYAVRGGVLYGRAVITEDGEYEITYAITDDLENTVVYTSEGDKTSIDELCGVSIAYITDSFHVYDPNGRKIMETMTPENLKVHIRPGVESQEPAFFSDGKDVYNINGFPVAVFAQGTSTPRITQSPIDGESFSFINKVFARDSERVYFFPEQGRFFRDYATTSVYVVPGAGSDTFEGIGSSFGRDDRRGFYEDVLIVDEGAETLEYVGGIYAKNQNQVWFGDKVIEGADPDTFSAVFSGNDDFIIYGKDAERVYYADQPIEGADPATFRSIEGTDTYYADATTVFVRGEPLDFSISPDGFAEVGHYYLKDAYSVFVRPRERETNWTRVDGADPASFQVVARHNEGMYFPEELYYRDDNRVFFRHLCGQTEACRSAEMLLSVESLESTPPFLKDHDTVYASPTFAGIPRGLVDVDAPTYETVGVCSVEYGMREYKRYYSKDKDSVYVGGDQKILIDGDTLILHEEEFFNSDRASTDIFAEDKNGVYVHCNYRLEGVDPTEFQVLSAKEFFNDSDAIGGVIEFRGAHYYRSAVPQHNVRSLKEFYELVELVEITS